MYQFKRTEGRGVPYSDHLLIMLMIIGAAFLVMRVVRGAAHVRAERVLRRWAKDNGYELLEMNYDWVKPGPFFWSTVFLGALDQVVYRVRAVKDGWVTEGWVCCGGLVLTMCGMPVRVAWDTRPRE